MDLRIKNKLALVTGSTHGIGRAIAEALAVEGARVIVNGRKKTAVKNTVASLSRHGEAHGVISDLSTAEGAQNLLSETARLGPIDILVNNVGFFEVFLGKIAPRLGKTVDDMRTAYFETTGAASLLQRFAAPEEIAAQVVFLCSERAAAINGAAQRVDGGIIRSLF